MSGPGLEWYTWNARRDRDVGGEREGPPGTNPKVTRAPPSPRSPRGARARSRSRSASTFLRRVSPENAKWDNTAPTVKKTGQAGSPRLLMDYGFSNLAKYGRLTTSARGVNKDSCSYLVQVERMVADGVSEQHRAGTRAARNGTDRQYMGEQKSCRQARTHKARDEKFGRLCRSGESLKIDLQCPWHLYYRTPRML